MRPQRTVGLLVGLALVVAACGGGASEVAGPAEASTNTTNGDPTPTTAVQPSQPGTPGETAQAAEERPAPDPNREIAPDFDLLLGDGSTFVLSEETRPVFMVFWAEW